MTREEVMEGFESTIKKLMATTWRARNLAWSEVTRWLAQFNPSSILEDDEQVHALFLLTHFLFFDQETVRVLLKSVFRDLYRTPLLHAMRRSNGDTTDRQFLEGAFQLELQRTRFIGVGNPSESGVHLLYYFRQENSLKKEQFVNSYDIFRSERTQGSVSIQLRDPTVRRYVFIDDVCGSGRQARDYLREWVETLKTLDSGISVVYYVLFAIPDGLEAVRKLGCFDEVEAVYELDASFRCLEPSSRIFDPPTPPLDRVKVRATCERYGDALWPPHPLGYKDGQLLLGFSHNTPDNTLPIFWFPHDPWIPVFKRYHKE